MLYFSEPFKTGNRLWRFLEEGESNKEEFDIFSIMKSTTMREYYKNNIKLSLGAMINIIAHSYVSIDDKIDYLKELKIHYRQSLSEFDASMIDSCIKYLENLSRVFSIREEHNDYIYILRVSRFIYNDFDYNGVASYTTEYTKNDVYVDNYFCNIQDIIDMYSATDDFIFHVDVYTPNAKLYASCIMRNNDTDDADIMLATCYDNDESTHIVNDIMYEKGEYFIPFIDDNLVSIEIPGLEKLPGMVTKWKTSKNTEYAMVNGTISDDNRYVKFQFNISTIGLDSKNEYSIFDIIK